MSIGLFKKLGKVKGPLSIWGFYQSIREELSIAGRREVYQAGVPSGPHLVL